MTIEVRNHPAGYELAPCALCLKNQHDRFPIAIRLKIDQVQKTASWENTTKGDSLHFKACVYKRNKDDKITKIEITADNDEKFSFVFLTRELFKQLIEDEIIDPVHGKTFASDKELQLHYLTENFNL